MGHDDINPGGLRITKGHANIDNDPLAFMRRAKTKQIKVHPDFTASAKRQKDKLVFIVFIFILRTRPSIRPI